MLDFCFQALSVLILYVRCTAIDPCDPGILLEADKTPTRKSHTEMDLSGNCFFFPNCCTGLLIDCMVIVNLTG